MSVGFDAKWTGTTGTPITAYTPDIGPSPTFVSGTDEVVLVGDGYIRAGTHNTDNIYLLPITSVGNLMDVSFDILCSSDLGQDTQIILNYDPSDGSGIAAGLRVSSQVQWSLSATGPNAPGYHYAPFVDLTPVVGRIYRVRLRVRPEDSMMWVDDNLVATYTGTDGLGTISNPNIAIMMSGALTISDTTGWHLGRVHVTTANPRPTARAFDTAFDDALQAEVLRLCMCVKVTRTDAVVLGFTTHDLDVVLSGTTYEAMSATQMSNIRQEVGGSADNIDVIGILSSDRITEDDMRAGRYDDATVAVILCFWDNPSLGGVTLIRGNIGDITLTDGAYQAGFRSLMQRFQQQIIELTSPTCRVFHLGDARCKFDLTGNTADGHAAQSSCSVATITDDVTLLMSSIVTVAGFYNEGLLISTSGLNEGYRREIKLHADGDTLGEKVITPSGVPTGNLVYRNVLNYANSTTPAFTIPAGTWLQGSIQIQSKWSLLSALSPGSADLRVQFPPGQVNEITIRSTSAEGNYTDVFQLSDALIALVNAAAGVGTMSIGIRHTSQSQDNIHYFNLNVTDIKLNLIGSIAAASSRIKLREPFPYDITPGDTFTIQVGCDRSVSTCKSRFGNVINFRGEPYIPGTNRLIQRGRAPGQ